MSNLRVQSLHIYPIKSLRGVSLDTSPVEWRGLQHDRRWMLVDADRNFLTQRTFPAMATVGVSLHAEGLRAHRDGLQDLEIPSAPSDERLRVTVWSAKVTALAVSAEADRWFSEALGVSCRLVYMPETTKRRVNPIYGEAIVGFSDAMPILVASQASLDHLNAQLDEPVPMDRFRANIILDGPAPHEEDEWEFLTFGDVRLRATKKCGRCAVTTTDQRTGERGVEPLRTLATYRRSGNSVQFGCYYAPESLGDVRVGQSGDAEAPANVY